MHSDRPFVAAGEEKLDLAYISPFNPIPSGLSDYSETLIPALAKYFEITLYSDCGTPTNPLIAEQFPLHPVSLLSEHHQEHDLRLYQIGNSPDHRSAFNQVRRLPGIITLHEPFLHHGLLAISPLRYRRELSYELGPIKQSTVERFMNLTIEDDRIQLLGAPLIGRIVDSSLGIVVHSETALHTITTHYLTPSYHQRRPVQKVVIPQLMPVLETYLPTSTREEFDLPKEALIFGTLGTIHPTKEPHLMLHAFAQTVKTLPNAKLVFIGAMPDDYNVPGLARELDIEPWVSFLKRVDPIDRMHRAISACDVIINLRRPTIGETSSAALRAMALERPVIVRDVGWYSELPSEKCFKINLEAGIEELASAMLTLATSPQMRQQIGKAARRYVQKECNAPTVARRYAEFLWNVYEHTCTSV
jgi:glycosyltransferase involved in cell wall biosynthesis